MHLLDGKKIAEKIELKLREEVSVLQGRKPGLAFIRIGQDPASIVYIRRKKAKCAAVGILSFSIELPDSCSEKVALEHIYALNNDPKVDGILLQLPLPSHLSPLTLIEAIDPKKDVDGFHPWNMGRLLLGSPNAIVPCTPKGIHRILLEYGISPAGKKVVIVGRSNIVGKPLAALLCQKTPYCNATVILAHGGTRNLDSLCKEADILVSAIGKPLFIKKNFVKEGAVVIDVGINAIENNNSRTLVGDVDFAEVAPICSYITPVPGGIGPMTIASLLINTLEIRNK